MKNNFKLYLKTLAGDNAVFDEQSGHRVIEVNGELIEQKHCSNCGEWHPLSQFSKSRTSQDGLYYCCKECSRKKCRKYREEKKRGSLPIQTDITVESMEPVAFNEPSKGNSVAEHLDCVLKEYNALKERVAVLEQERDTVQFDIKRLTDSDIESILRECKPPMRLLFDAIKEREGRYSFYAIDKETGCTMNIVSDRQ